MTIKIQCQCSRVIAVSEQLAGQPTRCPSCGRRHIVPAVKPAVPEPATTRTIELSDCKCRDCQSVLAKHAAFCHSCGLPTKPVVAPAPMTPVVFHAPMPAMPPVPMVPPTPPMPLQVQAGPFPNASAARESVGPFARAIAKQQRPISGLGRISMTCTYMAIFLGIFCAIFALPLLGGACGAHGQEIGIQQQLQQQLSLWTLLRGMGTLTILFALVGMLTGFLGLFHFGRRRWNAVAGLILSFVIFGFAGSGVAKTNKEIRKIRSNPNYISHTIDSKAGCDKHQGCCPFDSCRKQQETRTQSTKPQVAPAVPAEKIAPQQQQKADNRQQTAPPAKESKDQSDEGDGEEF